LKTDDAFTRKEVQRGRDLLRRGTSGEQFRANLRGSAKPKKTRKDVGRVPWTKKPPHGRRRTAQTSGSTSAKPTKGRRKHPVEVGGGGSQSPNPATKKFNREGQTPTV